MKHRYRRFGLGVVMALIVLVLFSSCTSFSNLVRSQVEGIPSWVYNPVVSSNRTAFVGKGNTQLIFNAKLMAYEDILKQVSDFIGEPVQDLYYRELTTTDAIEDFGLNIVNEYSKSDSRSPSQYYLLATADTAKLESKRTSVYNAVLQRDEDIAALIRKADSAYRANNDIEAIMLYFDAALIASEGPVTNKKYELDALLAKSITFINALKFSLSKSDPLQATATVQLRRRSRLLSPKVLNAPVVAEFDALNSLGARYADSLLFNTASEGFIQFVPYNYGLVGNGSIRFSVDFSSAMLTLAERIPQETLEPLQQALDKHGIDFSYSLVSGFASKKIIGDIREYEYTGTLRNTKEALSALLELYDSRGVTISPVSLIQEEEGDLYDEVALKAPGTNLVVRGKAGVVDESQIGDQSVVVVTGSIQLWDMSKRLLLSDTLEVEAVAFAPLAEDAKKKAFRRFGQISSSLLLSSFF
ncbi:MAG TPA: hypothetical protein GXZ69_01880 [Spirochaetales bacterium]|nr:hypothetical protein [Spirochaetales bacterium]